MVEFPPPKGSAGREQFGRRPALAVQTSDPAAANLPVTMTVPMTSNMDALRFPFTVEVQPSPANGLTRPSVLLVFQLRAIDNARVGNRLGTLEPQYLGQLEAEIRRLLELH